MTYSPPSATINYEQDTIRAGYSDVVFALAGRMSRKRCVLELYRLGNAHTAILSVARFEIRRLAQVGLAVPIDLITLARSLRPEQRHFFITVRDGVEEINYVPPFSLGTLREIMALDAWLKRRPEIHSITLVSCKSHLPRVRLCCKAILGRKVRLEFVAVQNDGAETDSTQIFHHLRLSVSEIVKFCLYAVLLSFKRPTGWEDLVVAWKKDRPSRA